VEKEALQIHDSRFAAVDSEEIKQPFMLLRTTSWEREKSVCVSKLFEVEKIPMKRWFPN